MLVSCSAMCSEYPPPYTRAQTTNSSLDRLNPLICVHFMVLEKFSLQKQTYKKQCLISVSLEQNTSLFFSLPKKMWRIKITRLFAAKWLPPELDCYCRKSFFLKSCPHFFVLVADWTFKADACSRSILHQLCAGV